MKKIAIAGLFVVFGTLPAVADAASSAQASQDFSKAVGESVANGSALASVAVALPVLSAATIGEAVAAPLFQEGSEILAHNANNRQPLPLSDKTIVKGPAPDEALRARQLNERN